jgi:hypothetical protein
MSYGCQLECRQTKKPNHTCPCYISTSPPMLELVHLAKHDPTSIKKTNYHYYFFGFWFYFHFGSHLFIFLLCNKIMPIFLLLHKPFCLLLTHSSHFVKNKPLGGYTEFMYSRSDSRGMREKKMQKVKWERGSHIYA